MQPIIDPSSELYQEDSTEHTGVRPTRPCVPHYFVLPSMKALGPVLRADANFFLEMAHRSGVDEDFLLLQKDRPDFGLCLTTLHAYHPQVAQIITQELNERFGLSLAKKIHIMSCLQEALSNAVIHGNLCINCPRDSLESFERYYQMVNDSVLEPDFKDLRVYVQAWSSPCHFRIRVTHEGMGVLGPDIICETQPEHDQKSGRGLFIIQTLADQVMTHDGCKSIEITFTY